MILYSLILEILVALVMLGVLVYCWRIGRKEKLGDEKGWKQILAGFALLSIGALVDISDHFPSLDAWLVLGRTPGQAFLEKVVGTLGGFSLVLIGLLRWLPHLVGRRKAESKLRAAHREMQERIRRGSEELNLRELDLEREIRERQAATQALERSQVLLERVLENAPIVLLAVDEVGVVTLAKGEALALVGFEPDDLEGRSLLDAYPETRPSLERALAGEVVTDTIAMGDRVFAYHHSPWIRETGSVKGVVTVATDVTESHRTQDALRQAKDRAEDANLAKTRFLANMSHELRTPLNSVIGFANVLIKNKRSTLDTTDLRYVERICDNGQHLLTLINEILDLSRIEAGHVTLELVTVDLADLIGSTLAQLRDRQTDGPVEVVADLPDSVRRLRTDAVKLRQVVINLVSNALKFTDEGEVRVALVTDPAGIPRAIEVSDTGIGIPEDDLDRVFDAFHQVDSSMTRSHGGAGLGLSISRSLCRLLGFDLTVSSVLGEGTTFRIDFSGGIVVEDGAPAAALERPRKRTLPLSPESLRGRRVLVIDDSADSRSLLLEALEDLGCEALWAQDGDEGFWLAHRERPDLILLDLMMPTMDGWDVLASLKRDSELASIPVVVVSALAEEQRGVLLGAIEALEKPVDSDQLALVLERLLLSEPAKVLVVEDEEEMRLLLEHLLTRAGFQVEMAAEGNEALERLEDYRPDLVLVDLVMPGMDGTTLIHALRADPRFRDLPVTVVTGRKLSSEEWHDLESYVEAILAKSRTLGEELCQVLNDQLLGEARPPATPPASSSGEPAP